jgi:hypothetical protein
MPPDLVQQLVAQLVTPSRSDDSPDDATAPPSGRVPRAGTFAERRDLPAARPPEPHDARPPHDDYGRRQHGAPTPSAPTFRVTIGRIEIQRPVPRQVEQAPDPLDAAAARGLSLDAYLRRRSGGRW